MTRGARCSGGGFFRGPKFLKVFVGILVEGFDATLATKPYEFALIKAVDGLPHAPKVVSGYEAGLQGIGFGLFLGFRFFLWGFGDLSFGRFGGGGGFGRGQGVGEADAESQEE